MKNKKDKKGDARPLPGEYPASEDALNNMERVHVDLDSLDTSRKSSAELREETIPDATAKAPGRKHAASDLTKEDYEALGPRDLSLDGGDDEQLKHRTRPVDFAGRDLDIPGSELDDNSEKLGSEDEENNGYSLGSDANANLEDGGRP